MSLKGNQHEYWWKGADRMRQPTIITWKAAGMGPVPSPGRFRSTFG